MLILEYENTKEDYMQTDGIQAEFFKAIASPVRIKILKYLLLKNSCVCDIAGILGEPQPQVSKALSGLRKAGIVGCEKNGKSSCYYVKSPEIARILELSERIISSESRKIMMAFNKTKKKAV